MVPETRVASLERHVCCRRCTDLCRYVRTLADQIGLRDWQVSVEHAPVGGADVARVRLHPGRRKLSIAFEEDFDGLPEEERRHAVVHELVHAHLRDLFETVQETAAEELSGVASRVFVGHVRRDIEAAVDALAEVLAPYLPAPSDPQG